MEGIKEILHEMLNDIFNSHPSQAKCAFDLLVKLFKNIIDNNIPYIISRCEEIVKK